MKTKKLPLVFAVTALAASCLAQTSPSKTYNVKDVGIKNFGQMDARFFRGERPGPKEMAMLKSIGLHRYSVLPRKFLKDLLGT